MRRAVAFSRSIKDSKRITAQFTEIVDAYATTERRRRPAPLRGRPRRRHLQRAAAQREARLAEGGHRRRRLCRILSNARCLSEGVDVPALDAVMFLNPRNSVVDVVQSVGRVMRQCRGQAYGYIILPIGDPADLTPEEALKDNQKYKVVWQVLQALRPTTTASTPRSTRSN